MWFETGGDVGAPAASVVYHQFFHVFAPPIALKVSSFGWVSWLVDIRGRSRWWRPWALLRSWRRPFSAASSLLRSSAAVALVAAADGCNGAAGVTAATIVLVA